MTSETAISRWLQKEMPHRGYPIGGPRSGGISRLAEDAGIPQASMSRIVNGRAEPSVDNLRKLGRVFGLSLNEMLVNAERARPDELAVRTIVGPVRAATDTPQSHVFVPEDVPLRDLDPWERHIWLTPDLSAEERANAIRFVRLQRRELTDDTKGLLALSAALNRIIAGHLGEQQDPPRAV